jgi:hypothetical protein
MEEEFDIEDFKVKNELLNANYTENDIRLAHDLLEEIGNLGLCNENFNIVIKKKLYNSNKVIDLKCKYFILYDGMLSSVLAFSFIDDYGEYLCKKLIELSRYYTMDVALSKNKWLGVAFSNAKGYISSS